jgi:imidazole glycerol phosphate synthase glutamine amidotransferase subunit
MITILDYGAGNLRSVQNTLDQLGAAYQLTHRPEGLQSASRILLPGVGHFGQLLRRIDELELRQPLMQKIRSGTPFLGICLGMQALFESSEEAPELTGFGVLAGKVKRFDPNLRVPHMGWNRLDLQQPSRLLKNLGEEAFVYFANSFYADPGPASVATTMYHSPFTSVVEKDNIFGVQFHPEKSGPVGLKIVQNFLEAS